VRRERYLELVLDVRYRTFDTEPVREEQPEREVTAVVRLAVEPSTALRLFRVSPAGWSRKVLNS
jgi:hypothetical protein